LIFFLRFGGGKFFGRGGSADIVMEISAEVDTVRAAGCFTREEMRREKRRKRFQLLMKYETDYGTTNFLSRFDIVLIVPFTAFPIRVRTSSSWSGETKSSCSLQPTKGK
jgi:hypothetical protein